MAAPNFHDLEYPAFILGAVTAAGGIMGYARTRSTPSIIAGCAVGLLCKPYSPKISAFLDPDGVADGLGGYRIQNEQPYGVELGLLASIVLGGSAFPRAIRLRKPVPILLSIISAFGLVTFGTALRRKA
ncbi:hypothetical protein ACJZ2D_011309 [Fusarium nematophilum]